MVKVEVEGVVLNLTTYAPVVILRNKKGEVLPIVIGIFEAQAILLALEETELSRPLTHDLVLEVLQKFDGTIVRLEIHSLRENVYLADVVLDIRGEEHKLDCRPSDGIALALRSGAPIFAGEDLLEAPDIIKYYEGKRFLRSNDMDKPIGKNETEEFRKVMENLSTKEFWKRLQEEDE